MAKGKRFVRYLSVLWDKEAGKRLQQEAEEALERAGKQGGEEFEKKMKEGGRRGGRALTSALDREYRIRMAKSRQALAEGLIDEKQFRKEGEEAARQFNLGLSAGVKKLRASGNLTDLQLAGITSRYKNAGGGQAGFLTRARGLMGFGPLAGIVTGAAVLNEANEAIAASDRYDASLRKLGGTAKQTGIDFDVLSAAAQRTKEEFGLSTPLANDLTGTMTKLAVRAGDAGMAQEALAGWMDLAASSGLGAAEALEALEITFRGQDEGLNKLGLANPADIYKKWGAGADEASKAQAILNEIITAGNRVQGEYAEYLTSNAGKAEQNANKIEEMQVQAGKAIQPFRELAGEIKVGLYTILGGVAERLNNIRTNPMWAEMQQRSAQRTRLLQDFFGMAPTTNLGAGGTWDPAPRTTTTPPPPRPGGNGGGGGPSEAEKRAAEARVKALWDHLEKWSRSQQAFDAVTGMAGGGTTGPSAPGIIGAVAVGRTAWDEYMDVVLMASEVSQEAAYQMSSAFQDAFSMMLDEGATIGNFFEGLGRGIAGSMLAGLAQMAQGKVAQNIASAIEAAAYALGFTSHGNFASAGAAWASAAQHTAAATAWGALAGGAGAGRAAMTGGRGAIPETVRAAGLNDARDAERTGPEIHVYVDGMDPHNPRHQQATRATIEKANERYGTDGRVYYHPNPGR